MTSEDMYHDIATELRSVRPLAACGLRTGEGRGGVWGKILGGINPRNPIAVEECRVFALALALALARAVSLEAVSMTY